MTSGNHVWDKKEILEFIAKENLLLRPANYPPGTPGAGFVVVKAGPQRVAVLNLQGRVFMPTVDCPFRVADGLLPQLRAETPAIVVDMHAEATSEKQAMGWYLDGQVTAVVGTHTHVATADERVLPQGTAYITDVGMTGPYDSVIGVTKETILNRFLTAMPARFDAAEKDVWLAAVLIQADPETGRALSIERLRLHGVRMEALDAPREVNLDMLRLVEPKLAARPNEGHVPVTVSGVTPERRNWTFPSGSVRVPTDQPLGDIVVLLLEPQSSESFFAWGLFPEVLSRVEYIEGYAIAPLAEAMLAADPALKAEFETKLAAEPDFAANGDARLQWFYERTPFYDDHFRLYPVGREN